jgi:hypothetical protein
MGWKIGANLDYLIGKKLLATLTAGYSMAGDETETGKLNGNPEFKSPVP